MCKKTLRSMTSSIEPSKTILSPMLHNWQKVDETEDVDVEAWSSDHGDEYHHGPICADCYLSVCVTCDPEWPELDDCLGYHPNIH